MPFAALFLMPASISCRRRAARPTRIAAAGSCSSSPRRRPHAQGRSGEVGDGHGPGGIDRRDRPAAAAVYGERFARSIGTRGPGSRSSCAGRHDLYLLGDRPSPLHRISLLPGALPTARDQQDVVRTLAAADVRLIITDRRQFTEYGETQFGGSFDKVLAAWIRRNYTHTTTLRKPLAPTLDVWLRRTR